MGVTVLATVDCDDCGERVEDDETIEYPMHGDEYLYGVNTDEGYALEGWMLDGLFAYCPKCKYNNGYERTDEEAIDNWLGDNDGD